MKCWFCYNFIDLLNLLPFFMGIHQCRACGSEDIKTDRSLGGRLICARCGSFVIGFKERKNSTKIYQGLKSLNPGIKISSDDWQYMLPFLACLVIFLATNTGVLNQSDFSYWSGGLLLQPYRIITSHFIHLDFEHLLSNTFGIVIARHFLRMLGLSNKLFFVLLISLLMPLQVLLHWFYDIVIVNNPMSLSAGFSGVLFGVDAFILLASIYGKRYFMGVEIALSNNYQARRTMTILTAIGAIYSLMPGVSLLGHLTGFVAGSLLFLV